MKKGKVLVSDMKDNTNDPYFSESIITKYSIVLEGSKYSLHVIH